VMFMDPRSIPATFEGLRSIVSEEPSDSETEIFKKLGNR